MIQLTRRTALLAGAAALTAPALAHAQNAPRLRMAIQFGMAYLPAMIADSEGLFAKHATAQGLRGAAFEVTKVGSSTAINDALFSGSVEMGVYGSTALLIAWDKTRGSQQVKGVCGLSLTPYTLLANADRIKSLKDFGPQDRIAVTSTIAPQATLLRMAAEKELGAGKHDALDTMMLSMPHPDALNALLNGVGVSAYFSTPPYTAEALKNPKIHRLVTSAQILGGKCTGATLGAQARFADANPKLVQATVDALGEAMAFIAADRRKAAEIYLKLEPQRMSVDEAAEILSDPERGYDLAPHGLVAFAEFMRRTGQLRNPLARWQDAFFPAVHGLTGT